MDPRKPPYHVVVRIAAAAEANVKTVSKLLRGEPVRGAVADRIRRALAAEGIAFAAELPDKTGGTR